MCYLFLVIQDIAYPWQILNQCRDIYKIVQFYYLAIWNFLFPVQYDVNKHFYKNRKAFLKLRNKGFLLYFFKYEGEVMLVGDLNWIILISW